MKLTSITPLRDYVLVALDPPGSVTAEGIIIPGKAEHLPISGTVVQLGPMFNGGMLDGALEVGERVAISSEATVHFFRLEGKDHVVTPFLGIYAKLGVASSLTLK